MLTRPLSLVVSLALLTFPAIGVAASPCAQHLTFRWTSGEPIRIDVIHPAPASLENRPFLSDPEILWVTEGRDRLGPEITVKLGPSAAATLADESEKHVEHQILILLGDRVLIAAIVRERLRDIVVAHVQIPDVEREKILKALQLEARGLSVPCV